MPPIPEYFQRIGQKPKYPELWDGCVGAWAPCLGPTGSILPNRGMRLGSSAIPSGVSWGSISGLSSLLFDNINSVAITPFSPASDFTVSVWLHSLATADPINYPIGVSGVGLFVNFGGTPWGFYDGVNVISGSGQVTGRNAHLMVAKRGTEYTLFRDGVLQSVFSGISMTATSLRIGSRGDRHFSGHIFDVMFFDYAVPGDLSGNLGRKPGAAYDTMNRRAFGFNLSLTSLLSLRRRAAA